MKPARILAALAALLVPALAWGQASPSPYTNAQRFDAAGRVTGTISAQPNDALGNPFMAVRNTYDPGGRLTKVETGYLTSWQPESVAPSSWGTAFAVYRTAETFYDAMGHKIKEQLRENSIGTLHSVTQYSYDIMGRLTCTAVRMNPAAFLSLPASACEHSAYDPARGRDRITRAVYDAAGQRLQLREGVGTDDEGTEATWAYDANGRVTTIVDGNGNRAELGYDGYGRQIRWTFPSPARPDSFDDTTPATALASAGGLNAADYEAYGYDANGNRTDLRRRDERHIAFAYDTLNRVVSKTYPQGGATPVYYDYNLQGLQRFARYSSPTGAGISNMFDGFGRLRATATNLTGTTRTLAYAYDRNGNRTETVHPDGLSLSMIYDSLNRPLYYYGTAGNVVIAYAYYYAHGGFYALNRYHPASGSLTGQTVHHYDEVQQLASLYQSMPGTFVQWTYGRDAASGISSISRDNDAFAWTGHYAVSRAYTTNGLNQYSLAGAVGMTYDANGNLATSGSSSYGYDIENRLISAPGNVALSYDPMGRLFQIAVNGSITRTFLYDGDALVAEYGPTGALVRRYAHWVGADVPLVSYDDATLGNPTHLYADHQGSIVAHANASGALAAINRYDEYGIPAAGNSGLFQYTGQIWLPELGMYHYKARVYSPYLGRFLQTDPVGYQGGLNLYGYVGSDPVNAADPTGTTCSPAGTQPGGAPAFSCTMDLVVTIIRNGASYDIGPHRAVGPQDAQMFSGFNQRYTDATNLVAQEAYRNPSSIITVEPFGPDDEGSFPTSAAHMLTELTNRTFAYATDGPPGRSMSTRGGPGWGQNQPPVTFVYQPGLSASLAGIVHEGGLHGSVDEQLGHLQFPGSKLGTTLDGPHQLPYNDAGCQGLGGTRCW